MNTAHSVKMLQAVAMMVGIALLFWSVGLPAFFRVAEAASITSASDTLSSAASSSLADHTITFTTPNGMAAGQNFTLTFESGFNLAGLIEDDVDIDVAGSASTTIAGAADGTNWGITFSGQDISFESPSAQGGIASSTAITIRIGTNAVDSGIGSNQITNPTATTSYKVDIAGTMPDSGQVRVAIIDNVTVSAAVDTSLTFTVAGVIDGQTVNGSPTTTVATTTATTLPFGTLVGGTSVTLAQDLTISTNAANGFTVTVEQTGNLVSSTGADIDGFIDGAYTGTPTAWQSPSALISDPDTYGHWGLTSEDTDFSATPDRWVSASSSPTAVFTHTSVASASTTRVGYQVEISALQEAGDDYTTTLRYIATPTF